MKTINTYINEKLRLTNKRQYSCQPEGFFDLRDIIIARINDEGNECDLNDIDTSKIDDMSNLFDAYYGKSNAMILSDFNGDISMWDVSNVKDMDSMFANCRNFNCDISKWDVSNVKHMRWMFFKCKKFNQDLDSWDVSKVEEMNHEFEGCPTTPTWYDKDKWE